MHPNIWIQEEAIKLVEKVLENADMADIYISYLKIIKPFLKEKIPYITDASFRKLL